MSSTITEILWALIGQVAAFGIGYIHARRKKLLEIQKALVYYDAIKAALPEAPAKYQFLSGYLKAIGHIQFENVPSADAAKVEVLLAETDANNLLGGDR